MSSEDQTLLRRYGTTTLEAVPQTLSIGRTELLWHAGAVRCLAFDGVEILRGITMVIRDACWGTHRLSSIASDVKHEGSVLELRQESRLDNEGGCILSAALSISIQDSGMDATLRLTAEQPFKTCRSGLVVLLPLAHIAGHDATVTHNDGTEETDRFDKRISPSQPFCSIRRLELNPAANLHMTLDLEGDVFEMEDQRNWSDASFKIYNRPLAWPSPYRLEAGECVEQRISLSVRTDDGSTHHA